MAFAEELHGVSSEINSASYQILVSPNTAAEMLTLKERHLFRFGGSPPSEENYNWKKTLFGCGFRV